MAYTKYIQVKDRLAVIYEGHNADYLIQLSSLRNAIRKAMPNISITIVCREEYLIWLTDDPDHMSLEAYKQRHTDWGRIMPLVYNASAELHPIFEQIQRSEIIPIRPMATSGSNVGVLCTQGNFPVENASQFQIDMAKRWMLMKGYTTLIADNLSSLERKNLSESAGCVAGIECDLLFAALNRGVPTALLESGKGTELYKMMANSPFVIQK